MDFVLYIIDILFLHGNVNTIFLVIKPYNVHTYRTFAILHREQPPTHIRDL